MMHEGIYGGSGAEGLGYRARVIDSGFRKAGLLLSCCSCLDIVGKDQITKGHPHFLK